MLRRNKYGAKKIKDPATGYVFDSKKEFIRWCELRILERTGKISDLQRQVKYELLPNQYESYARFSKTGKQLKDGVKLIERGVSYVADFVYKENGETVVEDCKGYRVEPYQIKKKLMLYMHNIKVKET